MVAALAAVLAAGAALLCGWGAIAEHLDAVELRDRGVRTDATIVAVHGGRTQLVDLTYRTAGGQLVRVEDVSAPAPLKVGRTVSVVYDPEDPQRARPVGEVRTEGDVGFLVVLAAACGVAGGVQTVRAVRRLPQTPS